MNRLPFSQTWRTRVAALLDDPVAHAVMRRDGLTLQDVIHQLTPVAEALNRRQPTAPRAQTRF